jgi:hypothetical protein
MPSTLAKWFHNLRTLQTCCQHPSCGGTLLAFAKTKPANVIANKEAFAACVQGSGGPLILDGALDKNSFREALEFLSAPLTTAAITFFFDFGSAGPLDPTKPFAALYPDDTARNSVFSGLVEEVSDDSVFPATTNARQQFLATANTPGITVKAVAEAVFPA